ncbi:MAG: stage II sporulation protein M [Candidatus Woesearchaeota archaeon]
MLEQINISFFEKRPYAAFLLGLTYVFVSFFTSKIFFPSIISVSMLFIITILLVPTVIKLIGIAERREKKDGIKHFLRDHKDIFEIYIFLFIGVFSAFVLVAFLYGINNFDYQIKFLQMQEGLTTELINTKTTEGIEISHLNFFVLLQNNLFVAVISFILSFFYGAGAMFLIVLNASIFSTFIAFFINELPNLTNKTLIFLIFMVHTLPELFGFLLAAIAGGVLSKALIQEKFLSYQFRNVTKDAFLIFFISICVILIAAFLETYITTFLFNHLIVGQL